MYSFTQKQHAETLKNITFGGQPGKHPTVLFAGIFFKGTSNYPKVEKYLNTMYTLSKQTGVPTIPDFFIRKTEYIPKIIDFILSIIPNEAPFSIDIIEPSIKIQALKQLHENDLLQRTIYNSIHIGVTQEEQQALNNYPPAMAILVAFNPKDTSPDGKIEVLENGAHLRENGLLDVAKQNGISHVLVDTAALAPGQNSGAAIAALPVIKEEYGLPVGCAIHNVVEKSSWLDRFSESRKLVDVASNINIPLFGGDFTLFGPINHADKIIPLIAWQDILISEYAEQYFGIKPVDTHPRRILL
jgi:tetrahydromethanopterin S-methyltransferase subunit H